MKFIDICAKYGYVAQHMEQKNYLNMECLMWETFGDCDSGVIAT